MSAVTRELAELRERAATLADLLGDVLALERSGPASLAAGARIRAEHYLASIGRPVRGAPRAREPRDVYQAEAEIQARRAARRVAK